MALLIEPVWNRNSYYTGSLAGGTTFNRTSMESKPSKHSNV